MDGELLSQTLPRLFLYAVFFYLMDQWVWSKSTGKSAFRGTFFGVLRLALGALLGYVIISYFQIPEYQRGGEESLQISAAVVLVCTRFIIWAGMFFLLRATGFRLAVGIAGGMIINLVMDLVQRLPLTTGVPWYV